jgi:hypothetical protein
VDLLSSGWQRPALSDPAAIYRLIGVDPFDAGDPCWMWQGPVGMGGYPVLPLAGRPDKPSGESAARAVYRIARPEEELPVEVQLRRRCSEKLCVKPEHGQRLTRAERLLVEEAAGQRPSLDSIRPAPKLDATQVRWIRENGMDSSKWEGMAKLMGVTKANIRAIMVRKTWKHVAPEIPAWTGDVAPPATVE